jgi:hypothetical protein
MRSNLNITTVFTKNPLMAAQSDYLNLFCRLGQVGDGHPAKHLWQDGSQP